jgi:putative oxidoreductase
MQALTTYGPLVGRVLIGLLFLLAGLGKLGDVAGFSGYLASGGLPAFLAWPAVIFELAVGILLIIGYQTRIVALATAAFCVVAGVLYHFAPADQMQMAMFLKNLAIAGGLLMFAIHGGRANWPLRPAPEYDTLPSSALAGEGPGRSLGPFLLQPNRLNPPA